MCVSSTSVKKSCLGLRVFRCLLPLAFDREHVSWFWEEKIDAKRYKNTFTEYDISSLYVRCNFHYAVSCTRFPAVRYCTNMGQMLFLTCFRLVFSFFAHLVRFGTVVLSSICIDLYRFCIDFVSIFVVGFRGQMQAVITPGGNAVFMRPHL